MAPIFNFWQIVPKRPYGGLEKQALQLKENANTRKTAANKKSHRKKNFTNFQLFKFKQNLQRTSEVSNDVTKFTN